MLEKSSICWISSFVFVAVENRESHADRSIVCTVWRSMAQSHSIGLHLHSRSVGPQIEYTRSRGPVSEDPPMRDPVSVILPRYGVVVHISSLLGVT